MNWLKQFLSREKLYAELDEEISAHLEQRVEELVSKGMSKEEAEAKARKEFGNVTAIKQTAREAWGWKWIEDFFVDLRYGLRMSQKNPVLTLAAVLTLALGIGANTAIFTLLYGLVLRSLPAAVDAGQLARVGVASTAQPDSAEQDGSAMTYHMMQAYRDKQTSFRDLSAWSEPNVEVPDQQGLIRTYDAAMVSGNALELLGLQPYRGRLIAEYDDVKPGRWLAGRGELRILEGALWRSGGRHREEDDGFGGAGDGGGSHATGVSGDVVRYAGEVVLPDAICTGGGEEARLARRKRRRHFCGARDREVEAGSKPGAGECGSEADARLAV